MVFFNCQKDLYWLVNEGLFIEHIEKNSETKSSLKEFLTSSYHDLAGDLGNLSGYKYMAYTGKFSFLKQITSSFMHADLWHLFGNMYFLWIFGSAVELCIGRLNYISFILGCSLFTGISFHLIASEPTFSLGASGFIYGLMGLFLILCHKIKVKTLFVFIYPKVIDIPSWVMLPFYIGKNIWAFMMGSSGNVNTVSHLSGAILGIALGFTIFVKYRYNTHQKVTE